MRLTASDVGFSYPGADERLLTGLDESWDAGAMYALRGPSGSGKSTLLDLLGAVRRPDHGSVTLVDDAGRALTPAAHRQECSWVLQGNILFARRSAIDNVMISALAAGVSASQARRDAGEALLLFRLGGKEARAVDSLSGGEKQRVTIARCLLAPAKVILADEPTGNLDAVNTALVVECLRLAASAGKTVIVATHDEAVVAACERVTNLADAR